MTVFFILVLKFLVSKFNFSLVTYARSLIHFIYFFSNKSLYKSFFMGKNERIVKKEYSDSYKKFRFSTQQRIHRPVHQGKKK